ncbi:UNVERIFIED_CONTAM: hypothetical protein Sradi_4357400, partial [Sesamum radiatum]
MPTIDDPENILPVPPYARRLFGHRIFMVYPSYNHCRLMQPRTPWNIRCPLINYSIVEMHHVERVLRQFGMIQDIPPNPLVSERRLHQIDRRGRRGEDWVAFHRDYILKWNDVHSLIVVRPMWYNLAENMTQQAENSDPNDFMSLRDLRSRTIAYGHQFMNFSSERYPSVRNRPPGTNEPDSSNVYTPAGPSNVYTEAGPSNVYTEAGPSNVYTPVGAGPSNVYTPAGPSNVYTEAGPSNVYTPPQSFNIYANAQRHLGISPVPFEGSKLNTPVDERQ